MTESGPFQTSMWRGASVSFGLEADARSHIGASMEGVASESSASLCALLKMHPPAPSSRHLPRPYTSSIRQRCAGKSTAVPAGNS